MGVPRRDSGYAPAGRTELTGTILIRAGCYILSALMLIGACAYTIYGEDRGTGIFLILFAVVLSRVLVINIAGAIEDAEAENNRTK